MEREVIRTLIGASILLALSVSPASAEPYKSKFIGDIATEHIVSKSVSVAGEALPYTVSYQAYPHSSKSRLLVAYPPGDIHEAMEGIVFFYRMFVTETVGSTADCRYGFNLNIFIIDKDKMLSEDRFAAYFRSIGWGGGIVYAFYDTTPEIKANSSILLTDLSPRQNYLSLAHEMAHYMWDRQCLSHHYGNDSEAFAKRFEAYIKKKTE